MYKRQEPTYSEIDGNWLNEEKYATIHRVASDGSHKGVLCNIINWCFSKFENLRCDTHENNIPMQNALEKNGFIRCGDVYKRQLYDCKKKEGKLWGTKL